MATAEITGDILRCATMAYYKKDDRLWFQIEEYPIAAVNENNVAIIKNGRFENISRNSDDGIGQIGKVTVWEPSDKLTIMAVLYTQDQSDGWIHDTMRQSIIDLEYKPVDEAMAEKLRGHIYGGQK